MQTPDVQKAIDELAMNYGAENIKHIGDGQGGAFVFVENAPLSPTYEQEKSWVGFHVTSSCPYADIYPHFVRGDLTRQDKKALGQGLSKDQFFPAKGTPGVNDADCRPAVQISRRSNKKDKSSNLETPLIKLQKVLKWLNFQ